MDVSSIAAQGSAMSTDQLQMEAQTLALKKQLDVQKMQGQGALELIQSSNVGNKGGVNLYA